MLDAIWQSQDQCKSNDDKQCKTPVKLYTRHVKGIERRGEALAVNPLAVVVDDDDKQWSSHRNSAGLWVRGCALALYFSLWSVAIVRGPLLCFMCTCVVAEKVLANSPSHYHISEETHCHQACQLQFPSKVGNKRGLLSIIGGTLLWMLFLL